MAAGQLAKAHVLVIGVSQQSVTGAEVHRGNTDLAQACYVRPTVLRLRLLPHRLNQGSRQRGVQSGASRRGKIHKIQLVTGEDLTHVGDRLVQGLIRGEPVVHVHCRRIRNHVTGNTTRNLHRIQTLTIVQALHRNSLRLVGGERRQRRCQCVNCVLAAPCTARVGGKATGAHEETHGAVAAALNGAVGRFKQHTEVCVSDKLAVVANQTRQAGKLARDLFVVVEDVGQVVVGVLRGQFGGKLQLNRHAALHVGGAATVEHAVAVLFTYRGRHGTQRSLNGGQGHGIQVTGKNNAGAFPLSAGQRREFGAGDNGVPVAGQLQVRAERQRHVHGVSNWLLIAGNRLVIQQGTGQLGHGHVQVQGRLRYRVTLRNIRGNAHPSTLQVPRYTHPRPQRPYRAYETVLKGL